MLSELGEIMAGYRRRTAEVRRARIVENISLRVWSCKFEDTQGIVNATQADVSAPLSVGQLVFLSRISAAGAPNGGFEIVKASRGTQPTQNAISSDQDAETITRIDSNPTTLVKGGAAVLVTIYGTGLSTAATYGDAGITNDVAEVITDTQITLHVKASGGMAVGQYTMTVAGATIPNFFNVTN